MTSNIFPSGSTPSNLLELSGTTSCVHVCSHCTYVCICVCALPTHTKNCIGKLLTDHFTTSVLLHICSIGSLKMLIDVSREVLVNWFHNDT